MKRKCDAVFEGGGVKGIGFAGALAALEKADYSFENVVGTSAGAIVAALIAAGYSGCELKRELQQVDYSKFREPAGCGKLGFLGDVVSLLHNYGLYSSDYFLHWIEELLAKKGVHTFGDLHTNYSEEKYKYKFQAVAADISMQNMLVLPGDLRQFGINPDRFSVAKAVQMSMSIPFYYQPTELTTKSGHKHYIADGGLLSNYPVWLLDDGSANPPWPTFGFKFTAHGEQPHMQQKIDNIIDYSKSVVSTLLDGHDNHYISTTKGDYQRSIMIDTQIKTGKETKIIATTYFEITKEESAALYQNGYDAAEKFLSNWNFLRWKQKFRQNS